MLKDMWLEPDDGILFLLANKEKFALAYSNEEVKIWRYLGLGE